jgi:hypothetical protein
MTGMSRREVMRALAVSAAVAVPVVASVSRLCPPKLFHATRGAGTAGAECCSGLSLSPVGT